MASSAAVNPLEPLLGQYRSIQTEITKLQTSASQATTQVCENELVLKELELLEEDSKVFKLIGPVLVVQELVEVKSNVSKRIDYINADMQRIEKTLKSKQDDQNAVKQRIQDLQKGRQ